MKIAWDVGVVVALTSLITATNLVIVVATPVPNNPQDDTQGPPVQNNPQGVAENPPVENKTEDFTETVPIQTSPQDISKNPQDENNLREFSQRPSVQNSLQDISKNPSSQNNPQGVTKNPLILNKPQAVTTKPPVQNNLQGVANNPSGLNKPQNVSKGSEAAVPTKNPEELKCNEMIGRYEKGKWVGLDVAYDLQKVLAKYGGLPGKVNATWTKKKDAVVVKTSDKRPLPVAEQKYRLYNYLDTDRKTWARGEYAVYRRFKGASKEFLEIRGDILWTPEDFCGRARHATYVDDDRGFTFQVTREYCSLSESKYSCRLPPGNCYSTKAGSDSCAFLRADLIQSLLGPG